jgi:hypothetical protein
MIMATTTNNSISVNPALVPSARLSFEVFAIILFLSHLHFVSSSVSPAAVRQVVVRPVVALQEVVGDPASVSFSPASSAPIA